MIKKTTYILLAATLLCAPQPKTKADIGDFLGAAAVCTAGIIGIGLIGSVIHHCCREATHSEELDSTRILCRESENTYNNSWYTYQKELNLSSNATSSFMPNQSIDILKLEILNSGYGQVSAFLEFKYGLDNTIRSINNTTKKLLAKNRCLFNRIIKLNKLNDNQTEELSEHERTFYIEQYKYFSQLTLEYNHKLNALCSNLQRLRSIVMNFSEYHEAVRLEEMKRLAERAERDRRWAERERQEARWERIRAERERLEAAKDHYTIVAATPNSTQPNISINIENNPVFNNTQTQSTKKEETSIDTSTNNKESKNNDESISWISSTTNNITDGGFWAD